MLDRRHLLGEIVQLALHVRDLPGERLDRLADGRQLLDGQHLPHQPVELELHVRDLPGERLDRGDRRAELQVEQLQVLLGRVDPRAELVLHAGHAAGDLRDVVQVLQRALEERGRDE